MMASGMAVIDLWGENTVYDFPDDCILLSKDNPLSIAMAIITLLDDDIKRTRQQKNAIEFMLTRDISNETDALVKLLENKDNVNNKSKTPNKLYTKEGYEHLEIPTPKIHEIIKNYCLPKPSIRHKIPPALTPLCKRIKSLFYLN
jgi:hypothetical protein